MLEIRVHGSALVSCSGKHFGTDLGVYHVPQSIAGENDDLVVRVDVEVRHVRLGAKSVPVGVGCLGVEWIVG